MSLVLIAEISPSAKIAKPNQDIFQNPEIVECNYILAIARPYTLGAENVLFEVNVGQVVTQNSREVFTGKTSFMLELNKEELVGWGENDEVCYNLIAQKINVSCLSFKNVNVNY